MAEELYLIYVNEVGETWDGHIVYEFLFSDTIQDIDGVSWDVYPAAGNPEPPRPDFVKAVGKMISEYKLVLIQNSDTFAIYDAIDGVVALAWEDLTGYEEYPEVRMCFKFGEASKSVIDKLYENDITLELKVMKNERSKK